MFYINGLKLKKLEYYMSNLRGQIIPSICVHDYTDMPELRKIVAMFPSIHFVDFVLICRQAFFRWLQDGKCHDILILKLELEKYIVVDRSQLIAFGKAERPESHIITRSKFSELHDENFEYADSWLSEEYKEYFLDVGSYVVYEEDLGRKSIGKVTRYTGSGVFEIKIIFQNQAIQVPVSNIGYVIKMDDVIEYKISGGEPDSPETAIKHRKLFPQVETSLNEKAKGETTTSSSMPTLKPILKPARTFEKRGKKKGVKFEDDRSLTKQGKLKSVDKNDGSPSRADREKIHGGTDWHQRQSTSRFINLEDNQPTPRSPIEEDTIPLTEIWATDGIDATPEQLHRDLPMSPTTMASPDQKRNIEVNNVPISSGSEKSEDDPFFNNWNQSPNKSNMKTPQNVDPDDGKSKEAPTSLKSSLDSPVPGDKTNELTSNKSSGSEKSEDDPFFNHWNQSPNNSNMKTPQNVDPNEGENKEAPTSLDKNSRDSRVPDETNESTLNTSTTGSAETSTEVEKANPSISGMPLHHNVGPDQEENIGHNSWATVRPSETIPSILKPHERAHSDDQNTPSTDSFGTLYKNDLTMGNDPATINDALQQTFTPPHTQNEVPEFAQPEDLEWEKNLPKYQFDRRQSRWQNKAFIELKSNWEVCCIRGKTVNLEHSKDGISREVEEPVDIFFIKSATDRPLSFTPAGSV